MFSGIIPIVLLSSVVSLSLLPFFRWFRETPHQMAAIKQLEDSLLDQDLLNEEAEWFQTWKTTGRSQQVYGVPWYSQLLSPTGYGARECFDYAASMTAAFFNVIKSPYEYRQVRRRFGDTTVVYAQVNALQELGLDAQFKKDLRPEDIEIELDAGRPIMLAYLAKGDFSKGEPPICDSENCGHWLVAVGYNSDELVVNDPMGRPLMELGGHDIAQSGELVRISRQAFYQRWLIEGEASGWGILVDR
jgi:hypothetical protein